MPLQFTAAHSSSRANKGKPKPKNPLKRSSSTAFSSNPRRKPTGAAKSSKSGTSRADEDDDERLNDIGVVAALSEDLSLRDVPQAIQYIQSKMFCEIPERSGMNSTRISETLNFRKNLPPIVSIAHVQALLNSPTNTEREIAELMKANVIRKIVVPGRSASGIGVGEALVLTASWDKMVRDSSELTEEVKEHYINLLHGHPNALTLPRSLFAVADTVALMRTGFLTAATDNYGTVNIMSTPGTASLGTLTSLARVGSTAAAGSMQAVGGEDAVHKVGGGGGGGVQSATMIGPGDFHLSLPTMGAFLRLLTAARGHLVMLLLKSRYREAPLDLLRERWDGSIISDDSTSSKKRARGEWTGVLPGRTRKWKQFYGLDFNWVLGEALGAGLVEIFETGSVGRGIRAI